VTSIRLTVNGRPVAAEVEPRLHLADFLRERLLLTGTHIGCEHGVCGACTVEIDGEIARSCITYAVSCEGAHVRTIEGFDDDPLMARLRKAFTEEHALQCGYCTPGMLIAARDLVRRRARLSRDEIRVAMSGNLCRCTGYVGIVNAIERVMAEEPAGAAAPAGYRTWLGPPPGPSGDGAPAAASAPAELRKVAAEKPAAPTRTAAGQRPQIKVTTSAPADIGAATQLTQSFHLAHPREAVWALISDPATLAACMPGMSLEGPPEGNRVRGRMSVKLGPIAASFAGEAEIQRFDAEYRQIVEGRGGDRRSASMVSGRIDCHLTEEPSAGGAPGTRVEVTIGYVLTGALAQFGRSALVRDVASRLGEAFAANLDAQLESPGARPPVRELSGFSLVFAVLIARLKALAGRLFGRRS
jgi:carbon-monoxide dehydrogenase small subunit